MAGLSVVILLLLISGLYAYAESVVHVPGKQNRTLQFYLCEGGILELPPNVELVLATNESHYMSHGHLCVVENLINVTLTSDLHEEGVAAQVVCTDPLNYTGLSIFPATGLAFANCTNMTMSNIVIMNCGAALSSNVLDSGNDNNSIFPAYFGTNQTVTLYFSHIRNLQLRQVAIEQYYGFAVAVVNPQGVSVLDSISVNATRSSELCPTLNNTVHGNYACYGSGILIYTHDSVEGSSVPPLSDTELILTNINLQHNYYYNNDWVCITNVFQFQPERVPIVAGAGLTTYFTQTKTKVIIKLANSTITSNNGYLSGGILAVFINSVLQSKLLILNVELSKNAILEYPCEGGAMVGYMYFTNSFINGERKYSPVSEILTPLMLKHVTITKNPGADYTPHVSSTVYIAMRSQPLYNVQVRLENVTFEKNGALYTGICMYAETVYEPMRRVKQLSVIMSNVRVENNRQLNSIATLTNSSQFVFNRIDQVWIEGIENQTSSFVNNIGSVIDAYASDVYFSGNVEFKNNTSTQGPAVLLRASSHMVLEENTTVLFQNNHAFLSGGAIFSVEDGTENYYCTIQVNSLQRNISELSIRVIMDGNTASQSGQSIYASQIYLCFQTRVHVFPRNLSNLYQEIFEFPQNTTEKQIVSPALGIVLCENSQHGYDQHYNPASIYPGDTLNVSLIGIDAIGKEVYSEVYASLSNCINILTPKEYWHLPDEQEIGSLFSNKCRNLYYTILVTSDDFNPEECGLLNFAVPGLPPMTNVTLSLKKCPPGFFHCTITGKCECKPDLDASVQCAEDNKTLQSIGYSSWIGIINSSVVAYASFCPTGYCEVGTYYLNVTDDNASVCIRNREGVLCGRCKGGYSTVFGSRECRQCSNLWLLTILAYIVIFTLFMCFLFLFRLSLHHGTIGGVIFYANAFKVIQTTSTNHPILWMYSYFIELVNLSQASSMCLYNGMTTEVNVIFIFLTAIFLWLSVLVVLALAHFSMRVSRLLVQSSVQVLVTVIHLSFSSVTFGIIYTFSYSVIVTDSNETFTVWLMDGTIPYGQTPLHVTLLITALLFAVGFILPYTLLGTFGSLFLRFWWMNKIRSFVDTMHSPYKDSFRCWFGARLILLQLLTVTFVLLQGENPFYLLLLDLVLVVAFTIVQAYCRPFSNQWIGILDTWLMANVVLLICINLYGMKSGRGTEYLLFAALTAVFVTFLGIIGYHAQVLYRSVVEKLKSRERLVSSRHCKPYNSVSSYRPDKESSNIDYGSCRLRESLLESD